MSAYTEYELEITRLKKELQQAQSVMNEYRHKIAELSTLCNSYSNRCGKLEKRVRYQRDKKEFYMEVYERMMTKQEKKDSRKEVNAMIKRRRNA